MATRLPPLNDVAPSSSLESSSSVSTTPAPASATVSVSATASIPLTSNPSSTALCTPNQDPDCVKQEASPTPSCFTSADGDTPVAENGGSTTAAGRKRKLNSTSSRGVANLTPEQLAKKRANDRQAQRAIRERTKSHIESLEQRVRELSSQKPFLDLQAALKRNEAIQAENRDLKHGLQAVMDIIQPLVAKQDPSECSLVLSCMLAWTISDTMDNRSASPSSAFSTSECFLQSAAVHRDSPLHLERPRIRVILYHDNFWRRNADVDTLGTYDECSSTR